MYFRVTLATGEMATIFHDLIRDSWFRQPVATPIEPIPSASSGQATGLAPQPPRASTSRKPRFQQVG